MLLTDLSSFGIDKQKNGSADHTQALYLLFKDFPSSDQSAVPDYNEYRLEPKTTNELNTELWQLITNRAQAITEQDLISILSLPDPFENFDANTWVLLHLACLRCEAIIVRHRIYAWLNTPAARASAGNAMQARLFLISQREFDLKRADSEIMIRPILTTENNAWAWFAVLSHPDFDIKNFKDDINLIRDNLPAALNQLLPFVKSSGIGPAEKQALFKNMIALDIQKELLASDIENLTALIIISSSIDEFTSEEMTFLATIANKQISGWSLELTDSQNDKVAAGRAKKWPEDSLYKMSEDFRQENARTSTNQFLTLIAVPGMLDRLLLNDGQDILTIKMNDALACFSTSFFRDLCPALWGTKFTAPRSFSDASVDWLMSLDAFQNLSFLLLVQETRGRILSAILQANDVHFITNLLEVQSHAEGNLLFSLITQMDDYSQNIEQGVTTVLQEKGLDIGKFWNILTGKFDKSYPEIKEATAYCQLKMMNVSKSIELFLLTPNFNIAEYYDKASGAFKALPQVNTAMQLQRLFAFAVSDLSPQKRRPSLHSSDLFSPLVEIRESAQENFDAEIFAGELIGRYGNKLQTLVGLMAPNTIAHSEQEKAVAYKKMKRIFELVKIVRKKSPAVMDEKLNNSDIFLQFVLTYRIERYLSEQNTTKDAMKEAFISLNRDPQSQRLKESKVDFLRGLVRYFSCHEVERKDYISTLYRTLHVANIKTGDKCLDINDWLKVKILHGKKTAQTLALLPDHVLKAFFEETNLNVPGETLSNAKAIEKRAFGKVFESATEKMAALNDLDSVEDSERSNKDAVSIKAPSGESEAQSSSHHDLTQGYTKDNSKLKSSKIFGVKLPFSKH